MLIELEACTMLAVGGGGCAVNGSTPSSYNNDHGASISALINDVFLVASNLIATGATVYLLQKQGSSIKSFYKLNNDGKITDSQIPNFGTLDINSYLAFGVSMGLQVAAIARMISNCWASNY